MKKSVLAMAVLGAFAANGATAADTATVSGFADIIYTITDEASDAAEDCTTNCTNDTEDKFTASGELDFTATPADGVTVRVDVDLELDGSDSGNIEQAYFAWGATDNVTVLGGVFNNPIGHEAEDAPDMNFTTHGAVYTALDSQTALDGDNVAGLGAAFGLGPVTATVAVLNDLNQVDEENSLALVLNYAAIEGLDLELGYASQTGNALLGDEDGVNTSVGDVVNFNAVFTGVENLELGLDYLMGDEVLDNAYDLWAGYTINAFTAKVRYSEIAYDDGDVDKAIAAAGADAVVGALDDVGLPGGDITATTLYLSYQVASNLSAALEFTTYDPDAEGAEKQDLATLEFIATF